MKHANGKQLNEARRGELLGLEMASDFDIVRYHGLTATNLAALVAEGFADPEETQNDSPSIGEFLAFMEGHPWALAHGYAVGPQRDDYRVSVEGMAGHAPTARDAEVFALMCEGADELKAQYAAGEVRSWWD